MAADNAVIPQLTFLSGLSWAKLKDERRIPQVIAAMHLKHAVISIMKFSILNFPLFILTHRAF